ncbi:MAG: helix-hairpin-helix domain-containing protein [Candidatus Acidiferrales bacterium]
MRRVIAFRWRSPALALALLMLCCGAALAQKKSPPAKPLDLNSATVEQLERVPGIGPKTAEAIVDFRTKSGPFRRVEDLQAIKGISKRKFEELRPYVTVTSPREAKSQ